MLNQRPWVLRTIRLTLLIAIAIWPATRGAEHAVASSDGNTLNTQVEAVAPSISHGAVNGCDVGYVTDLGNIDDGTANQGAFEGLMRAKLDFGIDVRWIETQRPTDYEANLREMVSQGCGLIVSVGFIMIEPTEEVALENPSVKFAIVDGYSGSTLSNLLALTFNYYDEGYLGGALAGLMTQSNVVGIVAGIQIPPVINLRTGYENGAEATNPAVTVLGRYMTSFNDPAAGAQQASDFIADGADVIFGAGGRTGSGAIRYATEHGVWGLGFDVDEYYITFDGGNAVGSRYLLSSAISRYDNAVYDTVVDYLNGDFTAGYTVHDLSNNGVGLAPFHEADPDVPQDVRDALATIGFDHQAVSAIIPPEGRILKSMDGLVHVEFPAGAFPSQVEVVYQPQVGHSGNNLMNIGRFFEIDVTNADAADRVAGLLQTSTIRVEYRNHEITGIGESTLALYWWNGSRWLREPSSSVDTAANTVTATPGHLGRFVVLGEERISFYLPLLRIVRS